MVTYDDFYDFIEKLVYTRPESLAIIIIAIISLMVGITGIVIQLRYKNSPINSSRLPPIILLTILFILIFNIFGVYNILFDLDLIAINLLLLPNMSIVIVIQLLRTIRLMYQIELRHNVADQFQYYHYFTQREIERLTNPDAITKHEAELLRGRKKKKGGDDDLKRKYLDNLTKSTRNLHQFYSIEELFVPHPDDDDGGDYVIVVGDQKHLVSPTNKNGNDAALQHFTGPDPADAHISPATAGASPLNPSSTTLTVGGGVGLGLSKYTNTSLSTTDLYGDVPSTIRSEGKAEDSTFRLDSHVLDGNNPPTIAPPVSPMNAQKSISIVLDDNIYDVGIAPASDHSFSEDNDDEGPGLTAVDIPPLASPSPPPDIPPISQGAGKHTAAAASSPVQKTAMHSSPSVQFDDKISVTHIPRDSTTVSRDDELSIEVDDDKLQAQATSQISTSAPASVIVDPDITHVNGAVPNTSSIPHASTGPQPSSHEQPPPSTGSRRTSLTPGATHANDDNSSIRTNTNTGGSNNTSTGSNDSDKPLTRDKFGRLFSRHVFYVRLPFTIGITILAYFLIGGIVALATIFMDRGNVQLIWYICFLIIFFSCIGIAWLLYHIRIRGYDIYLKQLKIYESIQKKQREAEAAARAAANGGVARLSSNTTPGNSTTMGSQHTHADSLGDNSSFGNLSFGGSMDDDAYFDQDHFSFDDNDYYQTTQTFYQQHRDGKRRGSTTFEEARNSLVLGIPLATGGVPIGGPRRSSFSTIESTNRSYNDFQPSPSMVSRNAGFSMLSKMHNEGLSEPATSPSGAVTTTIAIHGLDSQPHPSDPRKEPSPPQSHGSNDTIEMVALDIPDDAIVNPLHTPSPPPRISLTTVHIEKENHNGGIPQQPQDELQSNNSGGTTSSSRHRRTSTTLSAATDPAGGGSIAAITANVATTTTTVIPIASAAPSHGRHTSRRGSTGDSTQATVQPIKPRRVSKYHHYALRPLEPSKRLFSSKGLYAPLIQEMELTSVLLCLVYLAAFCFAFIGSLSNDEDKYGVYVAAPSYSSPAISRYMLLPLFFGYLLVLFIASLFFVTRLWFIRCCSRIKHSCRRDDHDTDTINSLDKDQADSAKQPGDPKTPQQQAGNDKGKGKAPEKRVHPLLQRFPTFKVMLESPKIAQILYEFASKGAWAENIAFLRAVNEYQSKFWFYFVKPSEVRMHATFIYSSYVSTNSVHQVNLKDDQVKSTQGQLKELTTNPDIFHECHEMETIEIQEAIYRYYDQGTMYHDILYDKARNIIFYEKTSFMLEDRATRDVDMLSRYTFEDFFNSISVDPEFNNYPFDEYETLIRQFIRSQYAALFDNLKDFISRVEKRFERESALKLAPILPHAVHQDNEGQQSHPPHMLQNNGVQDPGNGSALLTAANSPSTIPSLALSRRKSTSNHRASVSKNTQSLPLSHQYQHRNHRYRGQSNGPSGSLAPSTQGDDSLSNLHLHRRLDEHSLMSITWKLRCIKRRLLVLYQFTKDMMDIFGVATKEILVLIQRDKFNGFIRSDAWKRLCSDYDKQVVVYLKNKKRIQKRLKQMQQQKAEEKQRLLQQQLATAPLE